MKNFLTWLQEDDQSQYEIQSGDTLSRIAKQKGISMDELLQANPSIKNPDKIRAGESLNIPTKQPAAKPEQTQREFLPSDLMTGGMAGVVQGIKDTDKTPSTPPKSTQNSPFYNENIQRLYSAIAHAEHRGRNIGNPLEFNERLFIRTKDPSGKSSAFGPVQITRNTARGFFKQNPKDFQGIEDFTQKYIEQGNQMLKSDVSDPTYGAGCKGNLCSPEYNDPYQRMASGIFVGKMRELGIDPDKPIGPKELGSLTRSWRGVPEENDPTYYKIVRRYFEQQQ